LSASDNGRCMDVTHPNWRKNDGANRNSVGSSKGCRDHVSMKQLGLTRFIGMHQSGFFTLTFYTHILPSVVLYTISK
jgi:hypothetical protein